MSNGVNPRDIHRKPTQYLRMSHKQRHCQLVVKGTERGQNGRKLSDSHNCTTEKQVDENTWKRRDDSKGRAVQPEGEARTTF